MLEITYIILISFSSSLLSTGLTILVSTSMINYWKGSFRSAFLMFNMASI